MTMHKYDIPYPPSWQDVDLGGRTPLWAVYDESGGFEPAWALVSADNPSDAADLAHEASCGLLDFESETLVVRGVTVTYQWGTTRRDAFHYDRGLA